MVCLHLLYVVAKNPSIVAIIVINDGLQGAPKKYPIKEFY